MTSAQLAMPGAAAIASAVAKGDMRRVADFYKGVAIDGVVKPAAVAARPVARHVPGPSQPARAAREELRNAWHG